MRFFSTLPLIPFLFCPNFSSPSLTLWEKQTYNNCHHTHNTTYTHINNNNNHTPTSTTTWVIRAVRPPNGGSCLINEWQCDNGECINKDFVCDGRVDCLDNSDEADDNCRTGKTSGVLEMRGLIKRPLDGVEIKILIKFSFYRK